jgi:hypothetical protein
MSDEQDGKPILDPIVLIERNQALAAKRLREQRGIDHVQPATAITGQVIALEPIRAYVKVVQLSTPWRWPGRLMAALVHRQFLPALHDQLTADECYQYEGEPYIVLGDTLITSTFDGRHLKDNYEPREQYRTDDVLTWTRNQRSAQIEWDHAVAPGADVKRLERELKELKARVK